MRWDRRLAVFTVASLVLVMSAVVGVIMLTSFRIKSSGERIAGRAEEGFVNLMERVSDLDNVGHPRIARRGKFDTQDKYQDFDENWLNSMVIVGDGYLEDEIQYSHTVKFLLRTYDYENIYETTDTREVYGRYTDEVVMFKNGDIYYVDYRRGNLEYRFVVECQPLTEWLDGLV